MSSCRATNANLGGDRWNEEWKWQKHDRNDTEPLELRALLAALRPK